MRRTAPNIEEELSISQANDGTEERGDGAMTDFDIQELIRRIREYRDIDENALRYIVKDHDPYDAGGNYDHNIGLANMNDNGISVPDGEELKGRTEAFGTVLKFIDRIIAGES